MKEMYGFSNKLAQFGAPPVALATGNMGLLIVARFH